jgi:hypothetical protein
LLLEPQIEARAILILGVKGIGDVVGCLRRGRIGRRG